MKATEQLSSLEMMAVDPLRRVVAPRFCRGHQHAAAGLHVQPDGILAASWLVSTGWGGRRQSSGPPWFPPTGRTTSCRAPPRYLDLRPGGLTGLALFKTAMMPKPDLGRDGQATTRTVVHSSPAARSGFLYSPQSCLDKGDEVQQSRILVGPSLAGIGAILALALQVAGLSFKPEGETHTLRAHFDNIGGLKARSLVKVGGVVVGRQRHHP